MFVIEILFPDLWKDAGTKMEGNKHMYSATKSISARFTKKSKEFCQKAHVSKRQCMYTHLTVTSKKFLQGGWVTVEKNKFTIKQLITFYLSKKHHFLFGSS